MIQLPCPWCGPRNVAEFRYSGELAARPDPATATAEQWRDYLYLRRNPRGWVDETWYHTAGCRRFFRVSRDTVSNETRAIARSGATAPVDPTSTDSGAPDAGGAR
jgi:sarcosine oxidase, subunit delta